MRKFNIITIIGASIVASSTPAFAERQPQSMGADPRVQQVAFSPIDVVRVDTTQLINTAIELGRGEQINQVLLGNSEAFEVEVLSNRNTISVKPTIAGASTNMTVYTSQRALAFTLIEGAKRTPTYRVVVKFPTPSRVRPQIATAPRNVAYQYSGDAPFKPLRVWNNGRHTYFEFPRDLRPSVFTINPDGYEITTNSITRGGVVRVTGVSTEYAVRIGDEVICIRLVPGQPRPNAALDQRLAAKEY